MPTQTHNLPDIDSITEDELQPACDFSVVVLWGGQALGKPEPCEDPAHWHGLYPCCGKIVLACDRHQASLNAFYCTTCKKTHQNLMNWTRL